jgi:hypothetical protein
MLYVRRRFKPSKGMQLNAFSKCKPQPEVEEEEEEEEEEPSFLRLEGRAPHQLGLVAREGRVPHQPGRHQQTRGFHPDNE